MRLAVLLIGLLLSSGCVGSHVTGSLWVLQNVQMDQVLFRMTDAQRAEQAHLVDLSFADEALAVERARLAQALQTCPTPTRQPLAFSDGDRVRDGVRIRAGDDAARLQAVAQLALADWRIRRANATGDAAMCEGARTAMSGQSDAAQRTALAGQSQPGQRTATIDGLGEATVARGRGKPFQGDSRTAVSLYASSAVDGVTAKGPLPQYLAAVYGGTVMQTTQSTQSDAAAFVDQIAAAYPEYEPDALYVTLQASQDR